MATNNEIAISILSYSLCSSTLLLANKAAMFYIPYPSIISLLQIILSLIFIQIFSLVFHLQIDKLEWKKVKKYLIYVLAFTISRYSNMKALNQSNIETVIVFRACSPLTVSLIEYLFMGRAFPSLKSILSLLFVCIGALLYCLSDSEFNLHGLSAYSWVIIYFILLTFEMTYCKTLTSSVPMVSNWGPVYYCNSLAILPMILFGYFIGDFDNYSLNSFLQIPSIGLGIIFFSCIAGTFIG